MEYVTMLQQENEAKREEIGRMAGREGEAREIMRRLVRLLEEKGGGTEAAIRDAEKWVNEKG